MQRKSQHFGALPLWCLLPLAFPLDGQARVVIGPGWTCERGGVGVGGGPVHNDEHRFSARAHAKA